MGGRCTPLSFCYGSCFPPIPEATSGRRSPPSPRQQARGAEAGRGGAWRAVAGSGCRQPSSPPARRHREESRPRGRAVAGRGGARQGAGPELVRGVSVSPGGGSRRSEESVTGKKTREGAVERRDRLDQNRVTREKTVIVGPLRHQSVRLTLKWQLCVLSYHPSVLLRCREGEGRQASNTFEGFQTQEWTKGSTPSGHMSDGSVLFALSPELDGELR